MKSIFCLIACTLISSAALAARSSDNPSNTGLSAYGIDIYKFSRTHQGQVIAAINQLRSFSPAVVVPARYNVDRIVPWNQTLNYVDILMYDSRATNLGYTYKDGRVYLGPALFSQYGSFPAVMASTIFHEGDHHRFGSHDASPTSDKSDNGPYGLQAYYQYRVYHSIRFSASERRSAGNAGNYRAYYSIESQEAKKRLKKAYEKNIFPTLSPYGDPT
ncbi:MAG: hypothetical protein CL675_11310 [Bdellovibrionaceae bacterium]|nr:hypothetical protein [Pseudobdellovibrionaceae bacterium]